MQPFAWADQCKSGCILFLRTSAAIARGHPSWLFAHRGKSACEFRLAQFFLQALIMTAVRVMTPQKMSAADSRWTKCWAVGFLPW